MASGAPPAEGPWRKGYAAARRAYASGRPMAQPARSPAAPSAAHRGPQRARPRAGAGGVALAALLAGLLAAAGPASALAEVAASSYRFDLGGLPPGAARTGSFELTNRGPDPATVRLVPEGTATPFVQPSVTALPLAVGAAATVTFTYAVPADAAPGHHGEELRIVLADDAGGAAGSLSGATAILFTSRTTSVGVSAIEAPAEALPGGALEGRVLLVNAGNATATVRVLLELAPAAGGAALRSEDLGRAEVRPDAVAAVPFAWANLTVGRGEHVLRARVADPEPASVPVSGGAFAAPLLVGAREARFTLREARDAGGGDASVVVLVENTGTTPLDLRPALRVTPLAGGAAREVPLEPLALAAGASRELRASVALAPGAYRVEAFHLAGQGPALQAVPADAGLAMASTPAGPGAPLGLPATVAGLPTLPLLAAAAALGLAAAAALVVRRRARARAARPPAVAAPAAAPAAPPAAERVAVLLDLVTLAAPPGQALDPAAARVEALAGRPAGGAAAHGAVATQPEAAALVAALQAAGFEARVRLWGPDPAAAGAATRVAVAMDAQRLAAEAGTLVLATHDPALADVVRALAAQGRRVEVMGYRGGLPAALLEAARTVHLLDAAPPAPAAPAAEAAGSAAPPPAPGPRPPWVP